MSFHSRLHTGKRERVSIRAHLLLTRPISRDIDTIAATFLAALGQNHATLRQVRKWQDGSKLVLRSDHDSALIANSDIPLAGEHFLHALPPFCPPAQRMQKLNLIRNHEGFVTLCLKTRSEQFPRVPALFLRLVATLAPTLPFAGLLWCSTGRLHPAADIFDLSTLESQMKILLAPKLATTGPRRLPMIRFIGARQALGYQLGLHLVDISRETAISAAIAFATAAQQDPLLPAKTVFRHQGRVFRISHCERGRVTLVPVHESTLLTASACAANAVV